MNILQKYNRELIFLKKLGVYTYLTNRFPKLIFAQLTKGASTPDPKHEILKNFQERFALTTLVETGTYLGDTLYALQNRFQRMYSIELDHELYKNSKARFAKAQHVRIYEGDSGEILPQILQEIREPVLFWLDAHYSKGVTARGSIDTPIARELETIFSHHVKNHVILIDDARCFNGSDGYPTVTELENYVRSKSPNYSVEVEKDIMRIYPNSQK